MALINLLRGWPAPSLLPATAIKTAANAVLSDPTVFVPALQYGPDAGYEPLREHLSSWLSKFYPGAVTIPSRLCITGGASQNLATILQCYTDPTYTRNIWMVTPTYFLACPIFNDAGFAHKLRSVPEDAEGIDIAYLRKKLQEEEDALSKANTHSKERFKKRKPGSINKFYKHVIYCVPTFSNPSAKTMSLRRRIQLVELARDFDALVISDDVYDFLQWRADHSSSPSIPTLDSDHHLSTAPQPRLVDIDAHLLGGPSRPGADTFGNCVSNGSFSKIVGPGVRCGWAEASPAFAHGLSQNGAQKSGGAPSQMTSTFMAGLIESGVLQAHIRDSLQATYRRRWAGMMAAIDEYLGPLGVEVVPTAPSEGGRDGSGVSGAAESFPPPFDHLPNTTPHVAGGYFIYLRLPAGVSAGRLAARCKEEENLIIGGGPLFQVDGDEGAVDLGRYVRLCYSWEDEDKLREGVERLGACLRRVLEDGDVGERGAGDGKDQNGRIEQDVAGVK